MEDARRTNKFKVDQYDYLMKRIAIYEKALEIASRELEQYTHQDAEVIEEHIEEVARLYVNECWD